MAELLSLFKIREILAESGKTSINEMMSYLKHRYAGQYDPKTAREEARDLVKNMSF